MACLARLTLFLAASHSKSAIGLNRRMVCRRYHIFVWLKRPARIARQPFRRTFPQGTKRKARPCARRLRTLQWRKGAFMMTLKSRFRRSALLAAFAMVVGLALTFASPARADRCDDLAGQLKSQ